MAPIQALSQHFTDGEFRCHCGRVECNAPAPNPVLIEKLEILRARINQPIVINSGVRCAWYNAKVGGRPDSAHLTGDAADLWCVDSVLRWQLIANNFTNEPLFLRIGMDKTFIHVDVSARHVPRVIWLYQD